MLLSFLSPGSSFANRELFNEPSANPIERDSEMIKLSDFPSCWANAKQDLREINDHENPIREMFIDEVVMCK